MVRPLDPQCASTNLFTICAFCFTNREYHLLFLLPVRLVNFLGTYLVHNNDFKICYGAAILRRQEIESLSVTSPAWFSVKNPTVGFFLRILPTDFSSGVLKLSATAKALCCRCVHGQRQDFGVHYVVSLSNSAVFYSSQYTVLLPQSLGTTTLQGQRIFCSEMVAEEAGLNTVVPSNKRSS